MQAQEPTILPPLKTLCYSYNPNTKFSLASPMLAGAKPLQLVEGTVFPLKRPDIQLPPLQVCLNLYELPTPATPTQ